MLVITAFFNKKQSSCGHFCCLYSPTLLKKVAKMLFIGTKNKIGVYPLERGVVW